MAKNVILTLMTAAIVATLCAGSLGRADQSQSKATKVMAITIPTPHTPAVNGKLMYGNYCASCHGMNGKGDGPVGVALKVKPADLTELSRTNQGKFPFAHVATILQDGVNIPSHGNANMPVWGPVLGKMDQANPSQRQLRISNLSRYLQTIQAK